MKIVILDGYTENPGDLSWQDFENLGELTVYPRTSLLNRQEVINRLKEADVAITNKTPIDKLTIAASHNLKYIGVLATGYNIVDVETAREHHILVCNIPAYGTASVGQFAIGLLLEICHHIGHHDSAVHKGRWKNNPDWCFWDYPLIELADKTIGIIGFGRIGQTTGKIAAALGMKVIAHDKVENDAGRAIAQYVFLEELFARSDVITLHCPLFPNTQGIINAANIAKMKDGVIIINNSRGALIVETDLADALKSGKVYAAAVDVVSTEPIKEDNPLLTARNCIITPHISWAPKESRKRLMDVAVENLRAFIDGNPVNVVNK
ncbi:MAG: D-2-hydroxyacid dehydrogenase [Synergistaceae bacterium]|jgi:glycerate dehydrogenase|nr:D-2-hydroxyacid dehydrogenase [Synergistaceae bacterium]